jgi:hypothetical protein
MAQLRALRSGSIGRVRWWWWWWKSSGSQLWVISRSQDLVEVADADDPEDKEAGVFCMGQSCKQIIIICNNNTTTTIYIPSGGGTSA